MKLENLNRNTWYDIKKSDHFSDGYLGTFINIEGYERSELLIFIDGDSKKHFVIEVKDVDSLKIIDPNINGMKISSKQFKFNRNDVKEYIDLECSMDDYLEEFTEIIKEISREILINKNDPFVSVMDVIENWRSFLASNIKEVLTEEEQIGLLCELIILKKLCHINPNNALNSWRGPLGEKHDFIFYDWSFEVKGTRSVSHLHWINGIDQLKNTNNKDLAFISFLLTTSQNQNFTSIQTLILEIINGPLKSKPSLIELFYKLLLAAGYTKLYAEEYRKFKMNVIDCKFFKVDENFPKLTTDNLVEPLNNRVSTIRYKIDLQGVTGQNFNEIQWGKYFY